MVEIKKVWHRNHQTTYLVLQWTGDSEILELLSEHYTGKHFFRIDSRTGNFQFQFRQDGGWNIVPLKFWIVLEWDWSDVMDFVSPTGFAQYYREALKGSWSHGLLLPTWVKMDNSISVLLTCYKRPEYLTEQIDAITHQSVSPAEIVVWHNHHLDYPFPQDVFQGLPVVSCTPNQGVWPRFPFCLELKSRFCLVLDDDTIPGHRYLESCLNEFSRQPGIYGTVGLIHKGGVGEWRFMRYGWCYPNAKTQQVDMVGHSWFFERDWIRYYCLEPRYGTVYSGEDYHLSFALDKHLGVKTYVPPHPENDYSVWGSLKGAEYGGDKKALFYVPGQTENLEATHQSYMKAGFRTLELQGVDVKHLF